MLEEEISLFIARQPIFNNLRQVYGYELLFRDSKAATSFKDASSEMSTANVLSNLFEIGIDTITDGKRAFINFDYNFLLSDYIELIGPNKLVIEVLEDVKVDNILVERLLKLKEKGYLIALDDFVEDYKDYPLIPIADIIKYDIISTPLDTILVEINTALRHGKTILAEKIETEAEYKQAKDIGFNLFQGYFFKKPSIVAKSNNKKSIKSNYISIISELNNPEPSYDKISKIIESDVNLSYRLLRVLNNDNSVDMFYSIKRSLVYMGFKQMERWINILMFQDLSTDKPMELTRSSLIRSSFGASLARQSKLKSRHNEVSTMLLFSTLDALLDLPMDKALDGILLTNDIKEALIEESGELRPMVDLVIAYEKGNWEKVKSLSNDLSIDEENIYNEYLAALKYCKKISDKL